MGGNLSWRISLILTWLPSLPAASLSGCAGTYSLLNALGSLQQAILFAAGSYFQSSQVDWRGAIKVLRKAGETWCLLDIF